jgi:hypothetical protein
MENKLKISAATFAVFLLVILAVNFASASIATSKTASSVSNSYAVNAAKVASPSNNSPTTSNQPDNTAPLTIDDLEKLRTEIPKTLQETEANMPSVRTRFLMYTNDGVHIMWGVLGNGRFVGTDNQGKSCWGIYGHGIFAGFYDDQFFWGKYGGNDWKAEYLFGLNAAVGKYVLFPSPLARTSTNLP